MSDSRFPRRALLLNALRVAATLTVFNKALAQSQPTCIDPDELSDSQISLGASLRYTDQSAQAGKACGGCAYFHAAEPPGCGKCDILSRPVSATGHCVSWSAKS